MAGAGVGFAAFHVVEQRWPEIRVGAAFDDAARTLAWGQAAQVGQALFGHDDLHVVFGVVHVADHGHDAADAAALGGGRRHEHREVGVAREVARAADAVHDARAHHMGGVHVAVEVGLDHAVHGDDAEPAAHLGVVADLLRP